MSVEKALIVRKINNQWTVIIRISSLVGVQDTELATFVDRPMAIAPMASALVAFQQYLMPDRTWYQGDPAGYDMLKKMEIVVDE